MQHTPEPWRIVYGHDTHKVKRDGRGGIIGTVALSFEDYQRALKCVNACEGMEAPDDEIAWLQELEVDVLLDLEDCQERVVNLLVALREATVECANATPTKESAERLKDLAQEWAAAIAGEENPSG